MKPFKKEDVKVTYFERCLYIYGELPGLAYQHFKDDGTPWDDPYDGLFWSNEKHEKPSKEVLDALDENEVREKEYNRRELCRKQFRNEKAASDHSILAALDIRNKDNKKSISLSDYLDELEQKYR